MQKSQLHRMMKTMKRTRKTLPIDAGVAKKERSVNIYSPSQPSPSNEETIEIILPRFPDTQSKVDFHLYSQRKHDESDDLSNYTSVVQPVKEKGEPERSVSDTDVPVERTNQANDVPEDRRQWIAEYGDSSSSSSITSKYSSWIEKNDKAGDSGVAEVSPKKIEEPSQSNAANESDSDAVAQSNTSSNHHTCEICWKRFSIGYNLKLHMRTHSGKKALKCPHCNHTFTDRNSLLDHIRIHKVERPFYCTECGCSFLLEAHLIEHMHIHTCTKLSACSYCNGKFASNAMEQHVGAQTSERPMKKPLRKPFKCEKCGKAFSWKIDFDSHNYTHCKPYGCEVCGERFNRQAEWSKHIRCCPRTTKGSNQ